MCAPDDSTSVEQMSPCGYHRQQNDSLRFRDTSYRSWSAGAFRSTHRRRDDLSSADLCIDALIGYSLSGPPRGATATLIQAVNAHDAPVLALDAPSGVDTTNDVACEPVIQAAATMTLALPKEGLRSEATREFVGELYLTDISVPPELYAKPPLNLAIDPIFAKDDIVRIW